jgi:hypothetical protein
VTTRPAALTALPPDRWATGLTEIDAARAPDLRRGLFRFSEGRSKP